MLCEKRDSDFTSTLISRGGQREKHAKDGSIVLDVAGAPVLNAHPVTKKVRLKDTASFVREIVTDRTMTIQAEIASIGVETGFAFPTPVEFFAKGLSPEIRLAMVDSIAQTIRFAIECESDLQLLQDPTANNEWRLRLFPISDRRAEMSAMASAMNEAGF